MNQPTSSLDLSKNDINKLEINGFRIVEDVRGNEEHLGAKLDLSILDSACTAPKPVTALELLINESKSKIFKSNIIELDNCLKHITLPGTVTEFCGLPGSGRTQICLHLAVGVKGEVVFIHTNKNLNRERLKEICSKFNIESEILNKMICIEANDCVELLASVQYVENMENKDIKFIIIDSISWPVKQLITTERSPFLCVMFQKLRSLAKRHSFAIILTNDLTTKIYGGETHVTSSFGDSFHHFINNRILLTKNGFHHKAEICKNFGGSKSEAINEDFLKHETNTELDAIHPRFLGQQDAEVIRQYEIRNHFYCEECKLFFAPTIKGLKTHFKEDMVQHKPYASCFYCQGKVFEYKLNNETKLYHNCRDNKRSEDESSRD